MTEAETVEAKQIGRELARSLGDEAWSEKVHEAWNLIASHKDCSSREWALVLLVETLYSRADYEETERNHKNVASGFKKTADMLSKNNSNLDDLNAAWQVFNKTCGLDAGEQ